MIREQDHRSVARSVAGTRRSATPPREFKAHPGEVRPRRRSAASPPRAAPTRKPILVQKLVRAAFGNNNVDTCARVCHSPTGYGLTQTFGTSAGTQDFESVDEADVILVIGANPTDGHPVFASRMKKRLRAGRQADRHRSAPHRPRAHRRMSRPTIICRCSPAPTSRCSMRWPMSSSPRAWSTRPSCASAATGASSRTGRAFVAEPRNSPEAVESMTGVARRGSARRRAALTPPAATARSTTASASPSTARARPW